MGQRAVTCPVDEVLSAWAAGTLGGHDRDALDDHVSSCAVCRAITVAIAGVVPRIEGHGLGAEGGMIGRYRVTGSIGHGAMGVVLRGHDPVLEREVALKMVNSAHSTEETRARMLREAQTLARIDHPHVVKVFDAGMIGEEVFVAMAFVTGPTLALWLAGAPPTADRVAVLASAGEGIAAIHAAGLVHRDIKPDNIVIHDGGGIVVDLGLARPANTGGAAGSGVAGTPRYFAAELRSGGAATAATDQYAWATVVGDVLRDAPLSAREWRALVRWLACAKADAPGARFASMHEAIAALARVFTPTRRRWPWLAGAATVAVAAGAFGAWRLAAPASDECRGDELASWSARRTAVEVNLARAGADASRVVAAIDVRARDTASLHVAACEAGHAPSPDDRAHALRRQVCIDQTWAEAERILAVLATAEPRTVRTAVDDLIVVLPVTRCAGGTIPAVPGPPPAGRAGEVFALERELSAIHTDGDTPPAGRAARLRALDARVRALDYGPVTARWHSELAVALRDSGDLPGSRRELDTVVAVAEAVGDDNARTRALIDILREAFESGDRTSAALERNAEAAADRLGNPAITAELRMSEGLARYTRGDLPGALAAMRDASQLLDSVAIDAHAQLVLVAHNLGGIEQASGDLAAAQRTYDRGYAFAVARFGEGSPKVLQIRGARATNLLYAHDAAAARGELSAVAEGLTQRFGALAPPVAQARGYLCEADLALHDARSQASCDEALAAAEHAFASTPAQLAWWLVLDARQRVDAGQPAQAIELLERALAVTEKSAVSPTDRPTAQAYLAVALHAASRDPARAAALATTARGALEHDPTSADLLALLAKAFPAAR